MANWVGRNNAPGATYTFDSQVLNATNSASPTNDNFVVISPTSIGGAKQAKVNYNFDPDRNINEEVGGTSAINYEHQYLADHTLDGGPFTFSNALHMAGTLQIDMPNFGAQEAGTEPNFCFCWYDHTDTRHRVGLGLSNTTETGFTAQPNTVRADLFYASSAGSGFVFASKNGVQDQTNDNSRIPDGTYNFVFDYVPGNDVNSPDTTGSSMSATLTDVTDSNKKWFATKAPLANAPWFFDAFSLDSFGVIIRSTGSTLAADYNGNGGVDVGDYVLWRKGGPLASEVVEAGVVNDADYDAWKARFGNSVRNGVFNFTISDLSYTGGTAVSGSGVGAGAVPEPTTALLALFAGLVTAPSWRRRCWS
jgi:hypothetical protein